MQVLLKQTNLVPSKLLLRNEIRGFAEWLWMGAAATRPSADTRAVTGVADFHRLPKALWKSCATAELNSALLMFLVTLVGLITSPSLPTLTHREL